MFILGFRLRVGELLGGGPDSQQHARKNVDDWDPRQERDHLGAQNIKRNLK
jgi:hypothetical protein